MLPEPSCLKIAPVWARSQFFFFFWGPTRPLLPLCSMFGISVSPPLDITSNLSLCNNQCVFLLNDIFMSLGGNMMYCEGDCNLASSPYPSLSLPTSIVSICCHSPVILSQHVEMTVCGNGMSRRKLSLPIHRSFPSDCDSQSGALLLL